MVCLRNICINTLHKGDDAADDGDDNNNNWSVNSAYVGSLYKVLNLMLHVRVEEVGEWRGEAYVVRNAKFCIVECQMFLYWVNHGQWPACCRRWGMTYTRNFCLQNVTLGESFAGYRMWKDANDRHVRGIL